MSTVGTITKLATEVVGKAVGVAGKAVGVAGKAVHAVTSSADTETRDVQERSTPEKTPGKAAEKSSGAKGGPSAKTPRGPSVVPSPPQNVEPAEPVPPAEPVEPSTTEPKAASRDAAHHGRGTDPTDDWHDEIEDGPDVGINPATGLPHRSPGGE